jgi:hypothetical protein
MNENKPEVRSDLDQIYSAVMLDSEALEDAKMTLEVIKKTDPNVYDEMINDTLSLIRRALSNSILGAVDRLVDQERPVAWCIVENGRVHGLVKSKPAVMNAEKWQPLYTAPQKKEWVGLTDEEREEIALELPIDAVRITEAKLKEKNSE